MSAAEPIVDPYPVARQTINEACNALISAGEVLQRSDLSKSQRQELAQMVAGRARELSELAEKVRSGK